MSKVFETPKHLVGCVDLSDQQQSFDNLTDAAVATWKVHDTSVTCLPVVELREVSIKRHQDTASL